MPPRHIAAGGRTQRWADSCPGGPIGPFPARTVPSSESGAPPPARPLLLARGQRANLCNFRGDPLTRRALLLQGATPKNAAWLQRPASLDPKPPGSNVRDPRWRRCPPRPRYTRSSLSMRSEQGSTNQQQPALALLIIPQHQTRCHAQPKMHAVHVFCTGARILSFLSDLVGVGGVCTAPSVLFTAESK